GVAHRIVQVEYDLRMRSTEGITDDVVYLLFATRAYTPSTLDAGVEMDGDCRMRYVLRGLMPACKARLSYRKPLRPMIQLGIQRVRLLWNIREQQLDDHLLAGYRSRAVGGDLHAFTRVAATRRRQHALAFDLDHAGPAITVGAHAARVTQMRNLDAGTSRSLKKRFLWPAGDGLPIQRERYGHYSTSCGKYFITHRAGFGAACPRPQIEASTIAPDNSLMSGWSQF